jgi:hypothetical protein
LCAISNKENIFAKNPVVADIAISDSPKNNIIENKTTSALFSAKKV